MAHKVQPLPELDRAWEQLAIGDLAQASAAAHRFLRHHPEDPEPHHLLAEIALEEGSPEEAERHARQALSRDEEYFPARFLLAWLALERQDHAEARRLAERALDRAPSADDKAETFLLLAEIAEALGDAKSSRRHLLSASELAIEEPSLAARLASMLLDAHGEARRARDLLEPVVRRHPSNADARYYLGRAYHELGDSHRQIEEFLAAYDLDAKAHGPVFCLTTEEFITCAEETLDSLPAELREKLNNVAILAEPRPARALVAEGLDPRLMGLFDGPTLIESAPLPVRILLFQRNIEAVCTSCEEVRGEIAKTLLHEIGHYLGLDEEDLFVRGLD